MEDTEKTESQAASPTEAINTLPKTTTSAPERKIRPPIDYSSTRAFWQSIGARWKSVWTKNFILALLAGQVLSLCITCTSVTTTELVNRHWTLSTTQGFFLYFSLFLVYTPTTIYKYGISGWGKMILRDGWKYFFLAFCDVEANYLVVLAYQSTDLLSAMLLDAWAIPICLLLSWVYMRTKYHWTQLLGVGICIVGLALLFASDKLSGAKNFAAVNRAKGDGLIIAGATLYGITNASEEFLVRNRPLYEVVGQLGMWGFIINGVQSTLLERNQMPVVPWNGSIIGLLMAFTIAMFILYTIAPLLYRLSSSAYFNLSLLSSDFYGLLFGLFLYQYKPYWLYFVSYVIVIVGLITYFWHSTPEEQGALDPKPPTYVKARSAVAVQQEQQQEHDLDGKV